MYLIHHRTAWLFRSILFLTVMGTVLSGCSSDPTPNDGDCTDGGERTMACGDVDAGEQIQQCQNGQWTDVGDCQMPSVVDCVDGAKQTIACGTDDAGEQAQACHDGMWENVGECDLPDEADCTDGAEQTIACGTDDVGEQAQVCQDGAWENLGTCVVDLVIVEHPQNVTVPAGDEVQFHVVLNDSDRAVAWTWEVLWPHEQEWESIADTDGPTLTFVSHADQSGTRVRVRIQESNGNVLLSNEAQLVVVSQEGLPHGLVAVQGAKIIVDNGAGGLWPPETQASNEPPALQRVDLSTMTIADAWGDPVATRYTDESDTGTLELLYVQRDNGVQLPIAPGIYHYVLHDAEEDDVVLTQGAFEIEHVDESNIDAHEGDGKTFLLSGLSIQARTPQPGILSTIDLRDYQRRPMTPIHVEEAETFVRHDYLVLSQVIYRYTVETSLAGYAPILGEVYSPAKGSDRFRDHRHEGGALTLTFHVPKGADFSLNEKRTRHYEEFLDWNAARDATQSDDETDVYVAIVPKGHSLHYEAVVPGVTIKRAEMIRPTVSGSYDVELPTIDPNDVGAQGFMEASVLHSAGPSSVFTLWTDHPAVDSLAFDMMRVWQAMEGVTANYFIEPDFYFNVYGDSIALEAEGAPGRRRQRIHTVKQGVSVITFGYDPILVHQNNKDLFFNAIDPKNLGTIVVQVDEPNVDNIDLNIDASEFDTFYFEREHEAAPFTFTPTADKPLEVCVHAPLSISTWGDAWSCYDQNDDDSFTIDLLEGRNIVRATTDTSAQYYVLNAAAVDIVIEDEDNLQAGEPIRMQIFGLETPVPKLSGIYNPGFGGLVWGEYELNGEPLITARGQYNIAENAVLTFTVEEPGIYVLESGRIHCGLLGSAPGTHRYLRLTGYAPNFSAGSPTGLGPYYGALPPIVFEVH